MKVNGVIISPEQQAAACVAMRDDFTQSDVRAALLASGVPYSINDHLNAAQKRVSDKWFVWEVANRICQRERKAGRIVNVNNRKWRQVV